MSTVSISSIEQFVAAIEAAEQRLASGEVKARRAKSLLLQAEKARDEAAARQAEAEQQLTVIETALKKARTLVALVGDDVISQGEALLEQTWASAQAEVTCLQAEGEAAQTEVEKLMTTPEARAYMDYREAQERAQQRAREQARESLETQLAALRPGVAVGRAAEPLADLATQAEKTGFPDLAAQARDAAEAARRVAQAQVQAEAALRKRRMIRWAERRARQAQPGDFVFVVGKVESKDASQNERAGNGMDAALHLRPLPARSGRLRFQIVAALEMENPPGEYGDVPSRGRAWHWRQPPVGEIEGLTEAQAKMVTEIVQGKLRSGWAINRANARLARRAAEERVAARKSQVTRDTEETRGAQLVVAASRPAKPQPAEPELAQPEPQPSKAVGTGDLAGLSPHVTARLRRVGLDTREAVGEILATGESTFLALPGIGSATLAAVRAWLNATAQADVTETETALQPQTEGEAPVEEEARGKGRDETKAELQSQAEAEPPTGDQVENEGQHETEAKLQSQAGSESSTDDQAAVEAVQDEVETECQLQAESAIPTDDHAAVEVVNGEAEIECQLQAESAISTDDQAAAGVVRGEARTGSQPQIEPEPSTGDQVSVSLAQATAQAGSQFLVGDQTMAEAVQGGAKTKVNPLSQIEIPAPIVIVEGDEVSGQRLAQWRGAAHIGLIPVARRLGLNEIQMLVHEEQGQATLVVYWSGGETTVSCPADGRAGQMKALREVIGQIQAQAPTGF